MNEFLQEVAKLLPGMVGLLAGLVGAGAAILGVFLTDKLQRGRELRKARGEAIVELVRAWGEAYRRAFSGDFKGLSVEVESATASARLLLHVRKADFEGISKITSATTNTVNEKYAGVMIASAQEALMQWHVRGWGGERAFLHFKSIAANHGLELP